MVVIIGAGGAGVIAGTKPTVDSQIVKMDIPAPGVEEIRTEDTIDEVVTWETVLVESWGKHSLQVF